MNEISVEVAATFHLRKLEMSQVADHLTFFMKHPAAIVEKGVQGAEPQQHRQFQRPAHFAKGPVEGGVQIDHRSAQSEPRFQEERRQTDLPPRVAGAEGRQLKDTPEPSKVRPVP